MYKNIGWTLGNACPSKCKHCYSMQIRKKSQDLTKEIIDRVIKQIVKLGVETVNLGGNEPIFTNGLDINKSLLPYIINELTKRNIAVGITSSGISIKALYEHYPNEFKKLNDIDISLDSPDEEEHDENRGSKVYKIAIEALDLCQQYNIDSSIVMCAMKWNFTIDALKKLIQISKKYHANIRINMLKPTDKKHLSMMPSLEQINQGYELLIENCDTLDMSEPVLAAYYDHKKIKGCSCGISSFRINSITPEGKIPISPCVYMHHHQVGDLLVDEIDIIVNSKEFKELQKRNSQCENIKECSNCEKISICRGGCSAVAYWYHYHKTGIKDMFQKDPYCIIDTQKNKGVANHKKSKTLVHQNYLCTWIGRVKTENIDE